MRALALLNRHLSGLEAVAQILRLNVYVQSAADFTQQSEVADGASDLLYEIFGEQGVHTRTSVGVCQLPKNAAVELDLRVRCVHCMAKNWSKNRQKKGGGCGLGGY